MGLIASDTGGGEFQLAPAGTHIARCVQVIDIGTQYSKFYDKSSPKVVIGWELPSVQRSEQSSEPLIVFKRYTVSLHENAALRKDLQSWRGRQFTPEELAGFNLQAVAGHGCMVTISHRKDGDKTYSDVNSVVAPISGMEVPAQITETIIFDLDHFDEEVFGKFGENLQKTIRASAEMKAMSQSGPEAVPASEEDANEAFREVVHDEDDIPF